MSMYVHSYIYIYICAYVEDGDFKMLCPICKHAKACSNTILLLGTSWKTLRCSECRVTSTTAKWHCTCNQLWFTCVSHAAQGHLAKPSGVPRAVVKRPASTIIQCNNPPLDLQDGKRRRLHLGATQEGSKLQPNKRKQGKASAQGQLSSKQRHKLLNQQAVEAIDRMRLFKEAPIDPGMGHGIY